jgi:hypothetical protein
MKNIHRSFMRNKVNNSIKKVSNEAVEHMIFVTVAFRNGINLNAYILR